MSGREDISRKASSMASMGVLSSTTNQFRRWWASTCPIPASSMPVAVSYTTNNE